MNDLMLGEKRYWIIEAPAYANFFEVIRLLGDPDEMLTITGGYVPVKVLIHGASGESVVLYAPTQREEPVDAEYA